MRNTIFNAICNKLSQLDCLKGSDGTVRIYKYPVVQPDGYPAISITSTRLESAVADNQRDIRTYYFNIRIIQEKIAENFGPEKAERVAREREDEILNAFDSDNDLGVAGVLRTIPVSADWGYIEDNTRIVIDITLGVQAMVNISM